jgi:homoserine O-acetyltransferase
MLLLLASALLTGAIGDLRLESGQILRDCRVTYRTYGNLNADKSNVVLFPTWFNGASEDVEVYLKPGGLIDTSKYYVIVADALANGNATSPSNYQYTTPQKFPRVTIRDMVESQHQLLTKVLNLDRVKTVMGVSMGAMQAFQWAVSYPDFMESLIPIVGTPRMSERDVMLWSTYFKLGRNGEPQPEAAPAQASATEAATPKQSSLEKILGMLGQAPTMYKKYRQPFNAMRQFDAIVAHDISKLTNNDLDRAAAAMKARLLVVVATQDKAVSPETALQFARKNKAELMELKGPCGHQAYKCEIEALSPVLSRFLDAPSPAGPVIGVR